MATSYEIEILEANEKHVDNFKSGGLDVTPKKKALFITCMDCRLNPADAYGIKYGDAITLRSAGAAPEDAARSTIAAIHLLGVREVFLIKHTKCGVLGVPVETIHGVMKQNLGDAKSNEIAAFDPRVISNLEDSAREGVIYFRQHPLWIEGVRVTGWIHDTDTGELKKVVE